MKGYWGEKNYPLKTFINSHSWFHIIWEQQAKNLTALCSKLPRKMKTACPNVNLKILFSHKFRSLPKYIFLILSFSCSRKRRVFWPGGKRHPGVIEDFSTKRCPTTALGLSVAFGKSSITCTISLAWRVVCKERDRKAHSNKKENNNFY